MRMRLRTEDGSVLKNMIGYFEPFFTDMTMIADSDGLFTRMLTPGNFAALEVVLPKSVFDEYECEEEFKFSLPMDRLSAVAKRIPKERAVEFVIDTDSATATITIYDARRTEFELALLTPGELLEKALPAGAVSISMDGRQLAEIIKDIKAITGSGLGTKVKIICDEEKLVFAAGNVSDRAIITVDSADDSVIASYECESPVSAIYPVADLLDIVKVLKDSDFIFIQLDTNRPIRFSTTFGRGGSVTIIRAPIVDRSRR